MDTAYVIIEWIARIIAILLVFSLHEFAHAFVAYKFGDPTPKLQGRLTLNPVQHIDPIGFVMLCFAGFGWAKPVPINPNNFKKLRSGYFWTSAAGVIVNYAFAFVTLPLYYLSFDYLPQNSFAFSFFTKLFYQIFVLNLCCFVFNLIPLYPLDGFRVFECCFKRENALLTHLRRYGQYYLLTLVALSYVAERIEALAFLDVLGLFLNFALDIIGKPISLFWNFIFLLF